MLGPRSNQQLAGNTRGILLFIAKPIESHKYEPLLLTIV